MTYWKDRLAQVEDVKTRFEPGLATQQSTYLHMPEDDPRRQKFDQLRTFIHAQLCGPIRSFTELRAIINDPSTLVERTTVDGKPRMAFSSYTDEGGQQGYKEIEDPQSFFQILPPNIGVQLEKELNVCIERSRFLFRRFKANLLRG